MFSNLSVPIWSSTHSSLPAALKGVLFPASQPEQRCVHNPGPRSPGMRPIWKGQRKQQLQLYGTERDQQKSDLLLLPRLPENLSSKLSPMLRTPRGTHAPRYVGFRSFEYRVLKEYNSTHYKQPASAYTLTTERHSCSFLPCHDTHLQPLTVTLRSLNHTPIAQNHLRHPFRAVPSRSVLPHLKTIYGS